jgi:hypothetical protein
VLVLQLHVGWCSCWRAEKPHAAQNSVMISFTTNVLLVLMLVLVLTVALVSKPVTSSSASQARI